MTLSTHHHHRGDAADDLTEPQMDLVHLYKQYCAEEGCRANSAFLDELERQRHRTAKLHLSLRRNYLGPKGLRPVMRLMEYCQTLTSVDLEGNGVTNEAVDELSAVLEKHLGMQSIILRDNPITVAGGKRLLQLVERNHRITTLDLTGTDVFLALQERIHVVAAENARRTDPKLVEQAQHNTTQLPDAATKAYGGLLPPIRLKKAVIEPICCSKDAAHGEAAESPKTHRHAQPAAITAPQPRPPVPALASNQARMSAAQLSIIRKRFAERARIANEVNRSAANKAAYEVRSELQALEANSKSSAPTEEVLMPIAPPSPSSSSTTTAAGESEVEGDDVVGGGGEVQQQQQAACTDGSLTVAEVAADGAGVALAQPVVSLPSCTTNTNNNNNDGVLVVGGGGSLPLAEREAATQELTDLLDPARMMLLSSAEQFEVLFEQGCREYAHRHLDAAYLAWNEAMSIAVRQKNREWIAAISSNLQRLSYELLVQEGAQHLEAGRLEDADAAFVLALDVATKAHNAAWEAEMYQARRNVQNAVFHRCHEGALLVFDRLQRVEEVAITEDDYFVIPGTELMIAHTAPFVSEWARILLLQEAIGMWSEAARVYRRIGGTAEAVLKEIVDESLNTVAAYLVQHFFDHDEPSSLSWQRTSHYHHYERIMLSELWESLVAFIYQHLHHKLLGSVAAMQLGNLYLSTYQLPLAARQFESVVAYGRELKDLLVEATGLCFSAILNWQRANYSTADAQFADAVRKFDVLQREMPSPTNNNNNNGIGNNGNNNNAITAHGEDGSTEPSGQMQVRRAVPADYLDVMRHASIKHRVFIMVATYRYREALEMLEHGLTRKHRDILYEKMEANFSTSPTLEQIVSIAGELQSPLVYYLPRTRFVWSVDENIYVEEESILTWVVPQGPSHMRFVEVNVSKDFATTTHELLTTVRRGLLLDPLHTLGVESNIITTLHEHAWMKPLRTLYAIFIDPIIDFIMAQDLDFAEKKGVVTLIPADHVWLVPFNALIKRDTSCVYLVEEVAPQLAFSATHCAFGCVSLERVRTRDLRQNVGVVQGEVGPPTAALFSAPYALDPVRSSAEVEAILHAIAGATAEESRAAKAEAPDATILAGKDGVLRTLEEVRCEVAHARRLHFATGATAGITDGEMSGGLCLAQMNEGLGLLRATEVSHMELFAELVVLSHTNMSMSLMSSTHDDVLGLVRGFLSSGAPCVIAGQWCTPDMKPADLFVRFYEKLFHSRHAQAIEVRQALTNHPYDLGLTTDTLGDDAKHDNQVEQELARHKAVVLAKAMRSLLETEEGFRFNPRAWAGYYCIGYGFC